MRCSVLVLGLVVAGVGAQAAEVWRWSYPLPQGNALVDVAWGGGRWVAVGDAGSVVGGDGEGAWSAAAVDTADLRAVAWCGDRFLAVSADGVVRASATGAQWRAVARLGFAAASLACGENVGVLVGGVEGGAAVSVDGGMTWVRRDSGTGYVLGSATATRSGFLVVGDSPDRAPSVLATSDGVRWGIAEVPAAAGLGGLVLGEDRVVAAGSWCEPLPEGCAMHGLVAGSDDGGLAFVPLPLAWDPLHDVAWTGREFTAVGDGGTVVRSADGIEWELVRPGDGGASFEGVAVGASGLLAVGSQGCLAASSDGSSWDTANCAPRADLHGVAVAGGRWVAVGGRSALTSADGQQWRATAEDRLALATHLRAIASNGTSFLAVGQGGEALATADGERWEVRSYGTGDPLNDVVWTGTEYLAGGRGREGGARILASADGRIWTARLEELDGEILGLARGPSGMVAVGGSRVLASADGVRWQATGLDPTLRLRAVAWGPGRFVAVGDDGRVATSLDGRAWSESASGVTADLLDVVWTGRELVAGGAAGSVITSADGLAWRGDTCPTRGRLHGLAAAAGTVVAVGERASVLTRTERLPQPRPRLRRTE